MKHLYLLFLIIGISLSSAQDKVQKSSPAKSSSSKKSDSAKTADDQGSSYGKTSVGPGKGYGESMTQAPASYPGGDDSLGVYLSKNFKYLYQSQSKGQHGQMNIGFTIDKTGKIQNPMVFQSSGNKDVDAEAVRAVEAMPNWKPGTTGGHPVDVQYILPIDYFIPE